MTCRHAERNLALIRQLEAETRQLLESLKQPDAEQSTWLQDGRLVLPAPEPGPTSFLLTRDGQQALAYADGHGTWIRWLE
jgi:hypothetical protein